MEKSVELLKPIILSEEIKSRCLENHKAREIVRINYISEGLSLGGAIGLFFGWVPAIAIDAIVHGSWHFGFRAFGLTWFLIGISSMSLGVLICKKFWKPRQSKAKILLLDSLNQSAVLIYQRHEVLNKYIEKMNNLIQSAAYAGTTLSQNEQTYYHKLQEEISSLKNDIIPFANIELKKAQDELSEEISLRTGLLDIPSLEREVAGHEKRAMNELAERDKKLALIGPRR